MAAETLDEDGQPRFIWADVPVGALDYARVVMATVIEARRWRAQYDRAKALTGGADPPVDNGSATGRPMSLSAAV
jgi:hypothetical protein